MPHSRIAVCSWSLRPATPGELVDALKQHDIPAVQLALNPVLENPEAWADAPQRLADAGIQVVSGMMAMHSEDYSSLESIAVTGGVRPTATWPANLDLAGKIAALATDLGIGLVTFHAGFLPERPDDPERAVMLDRLRTIAGLFAERRIDLALETGQETAEVLCEMLEALCAKNVGVNFDPANMILYGKGDPVLGLEALSPSVRQIHVKDALPAATPGTWGEEVPVGCGAVEWDAFFEVAAQIQPPANFVIEREAGENRLQDIIAARDLIARFIQS